MHRNALQNDMLIEGLTRRFLHQRPSVEFMERFLPNDGRVVDLGCGHGLPLRHLAQQRPDLTFVGVDHSLDILDKTVAGELSNVVLTLSDLISPCFPDGHFGAAIFNRSLHEVYSVHGRDPMRSALRVAHRYLPAGGRLLIYENVVASRDQVSIRFLTEEVEQSFRRFVHDYSIRPIAHAALAPGVISLRRDDALEFLTKYREPDWESEMREAHFIFTLAEWDAELAACGFARVAAHDFDDRQILVTEGVDLDWRIADFKHVLVYEAAHATVG